MKELTFLLCLIGAVLNVNAQNFECDNGDGSDGSLVVSSSNTIVNDYAYLIANAAASATVIEINDASAFSIGDQVLIIQMQTALGGTSGTHEIARIAGITANQLTLTTSTTNAFYSGSFETTTSSTAQVVRIPEYTTVTIDASGSIVAKSWDGYSGGIIIFSATTSIINNGSIDVSGQGYRGGLGGLVNFQGESHPGIGVGYVRAANGGGGAPGHQTTYAGGGNGAHGGGGGGHKSDGTDGALSTGSPGPTRPGGIAYSDNTGTTFTMGSGGGSGGVDSYFQLYPVGGNGGGIILLSTPTIASSGGILAIGDDGPNGIGGLKGGSGGGAGGYICIYSASGPVLTSVNGGSGGSPSCCGRGAGGAGSDGFSISKTAPVACNIASDLFITKWLVAAGETITIPTTGSGYDYGVDWSYDAGDGFNAESANQTGNATSPSLSAGEHIVAITGDFPRIYFNNSGDRNKITEIVQWGTNPWTSMNRAFEGCSNLNIVNPSVGEPDLSSVTNMRRMFYRASSFNSAIGDWNVSNITNMSLLFARCHSFNQDLNNWDVSSVTDMRYMFLVAPSFDQDLGAWDIGNVTTMEQMFFDAGLSTANYDSTLIGWAADSSGTPGDGLDDIPINITFEGGSSTYCNGETARDLLTATLPSPTGYGWTITDDGLDCAPFITKWVVLAGETITIPTTGFGYDYDVDWSYNAIDGFNAESTNQTGNATSPSLTAGEHIVAITGDFPRIFFNNGGDKNKITEIVQWGTNPWTSMLNAFSGCENLNITNPDAGTPNLSLVTNMRRMFNLADSFNGDVGDWDVSNVTDMSYLFKRCRSFNQDISNWNTTNVTTMREMFNQAWVFNGSLDWDVSNVEDMSGMFFHALAFNQDLSSWDTSNVTDMFRMFNDAESFDQSLGAWDIGNVTNMEQFLFDAGLSTANYDSTLIGWAEDSSGSSDGIDDIPTNIIFDGGSSNYCASEASRALLIAAGPAPTGYGWTITDDGLDLELDCIAPESLFIFVMSASQGQHIYVYAFGNNYDVDWSYDASDGFNAESTNLSNGALSPSLNSGGHVFAIAGDLRGVAFGNDRFAIDELKEIVQWGTSPWLYMGQMFYECFNMNITNPNIDAPDLSNVTYMDEMFYDATSFNGAIGDWDVSNVESMYAIFSSATAFNQDISNWNTSNVNDMSYMFSLATAFNQDISNWNTSSVTDMCSMFDTAPSFDQNLGAWDIGNMTTMEGMFFGSELSLNNYDNTLIGWATDSSGSPDDGIDDIPTNIVFDGGNSKYCNGEAARDLLTTVYGWTITDGGLDCTPPLHAPLLGRNSSSLDSISLYPNPTQNLVTIVSPQEVVTSATVYDIQGRKVSEVDFSNQTNYQIDLSSMEAAVYLIEIATENGTVMKRVMKK